MRVPHFVGLHAMQALPLHYAFLAAHDFPAPLALDAAYHALLLWPVAALAAVPHLSR